MEFSKIDVVYNVMEGAMFHTHQGIELSSFVDVALDLEARIEVTSETMLDSCSSGIRGDVEDITITGIQSSG